MTNEKQKKIGDDRPIAHGQANIKVVGIGGGGGNAVHRMKNTLKKALILLL